MSKYTGVNITNVESEKADCLNQEVFLTLAQAALELNRTIQTLSNNAKKESGIRNVTISGCCFENADIGVKTDNKKKKFIKGDQG